MIVREIVETKLSLDRIANVLQVIVDSYRENSKLLILARGSCFLKRIF